MKMTEIVTVPVIVGFCYLIGYIIKLFKNEQLNNFIPGICIVIGVILGVVSFYTIPNLVPASNWLGASVIGGFSGLSATGVNQVVKKLKLMINDKGGE
jgi:hypothetical protein